MQTLREFFASSSGLAPARQGLGLGWIISALTGLTVLLGAKEAEACRILYCVPDPKNCPLPEEPIFCCDDCGGGWCTA